MRIRRDGRFSGRIFFKHFTIEYVFGRFRFNIGYCPCEHHTLVFVIPLIGFYFSWGSARHDRAMELSLHSWAIWWNLWTSSMEWNSKTPKWRNGSWHFLDTILGKTKYTRNVIDERDVEIPMPEGCYNAHVKLCEDVWKRPRWFSSTVKRIDADIPGGIPHEGKGTCSHNCGVDGCFGMCAPANTIAEGVGEIVGSVLSSRVKYGGWQDWKWTK